MSRRRLLGSRCRLLGSTFLVWGSLRGVSCPSHEQAPTMHGTVVASCTSSTRQPSVATQMPRAQQSECRPLPRSCTAGV